MTYKSLLLHTYFVYLLYKSLILHRYFVFVLYIKVLYFYVDKYFVYILQELFVFILHKSSVFVLYKSFGQLQKNISHFNSKFFARDKWRLKRQQKCNTLLSMLSFISFRLFYFRLYFHQTLFFFHY